MLDAEENPRSPDNSDSSPAASAKHGIFWCLMFARCFSHASLDADAELAETVWGLASSPKDDDVFRRVGYFIGNTDCIP